jgi:uncharacterized membrane protein
MAKKKSDTNPLDPDVPEKANAAAADTGPAADFTAPQQSPYQTSEYPTAPPSITEEETRKFEGARFDPYAYQPQPAPMVYQPVGFADMNRAGDRKVAKTGVPEKWLVGLPYIPFWIGLIAGLIMLLVIPKEENKVRFHAAQGFGAHIAILIVSSILGVIGNITNQGFGSFLFGLAATIMMIVWAIKAWKGKPVHIEILDDVTNWFEEKIGPIKSS